MADLPLNGDGSARYGAPPPPDEPIEVGRYADALRRSWLLILLIVVVAVAGIVGIVVLVAAWL